MKTTWQPSLSVPLTTDIAGRHSCLLMILSWDCSPEMAKLRKATKLWSFPTKNRIFHYYFPFRNLELPTEEFAKGVRDLCDRTGALLIVDDVRAGFRLNTKVGLLEILRIGLDWVAPGTPCMA